MHIIPLSCASTLKSYNKGSTHGKSNTSRLGDIAALHSDQTKTVLVLSFPKSGDCNIDADVEMGVLRALLPLHVLRDLMQSLLNLAGNVLRLSADKVALV